MKSQQRFINQLEAWLTKRHLIIVGIIILISLTFRIIYFNQISHSPLINFHKWSESDMNFFDTWGVYLAEEDWLADTSLHPHHSWHQEIAELYFQNHEVEYQTYIDSIQNSNSKLSPEQLLLNRWFGEKKYHQEPLYAYTLAATYAIGGKEIKIVYIWQMVLGIFSIVLIYLITRRYFGEIPRLLAAFIAILIPFSSYALYKGFKYILTNYRHALLFIGIGCLLFLWTSRKLPEGMQVDRYADYHVVEEYFYKSYYAGLFQQNNNTQAIKQLKDQLSRSPDFINSLTGYNIVRYRDEQMIALYYANINYKLAQLYKMEGNEFWANKYMTRSYELQNSSGY